MLQVISSQKIYRDLLTGLILPEETPEPKEWDRLDSIYSEGILALTERAPKLSLADHVLGCSILTAHFFQRPMDLRETFPFFAGSCAMQGTGTSYDPTRSTRWDMDRNSKLPELPEDMASLFLGDSATLTIPRLDLFFKTGLALGILTDQDVTAALEKIHIIEGKLVFVDVAFAHRFGQLYLMTAERLWSNMRLVVFHRVTAHLLAGLPEISLIEMSDPEVYELLQKNCEDEVLWKLITSPHTEVFVEHHEPMFYFRWKLRHIDPIVQWKGNLEKLSEIRDDFSAYLEREWDRVRGVHGISIRHPSFQVKAEFFSGFQDS